MPPAISTFFRNSNYAEAVVWCVIGLVIVILGARWRFSPRDRVLLLLTLIAFGASDVVEAQTGAWWNPWWLLAWKGLCIAVLLVVMIQRIRQNRLRAVKEE